QILAAHGDQVGSIAVTCAQEDDLVEERWGRGRRAREVDGRDYIRTVAGILEQDHSIAGIRNVDQVVLRGGRHGRSGAEVVAPALRARVAVEAIDLAILAGRDDIGT